MRAVCEVDWVLGVFGFSSTKSVGTHLRRLIVVGFNFIHPARWCFILSGSWAWNSARCDEKHRKLLQLWEPAWANVRLRRENHGGEKDKCSICRGRNSHKTAGKAVHRKQLSKGAFFCTWTSPPGFAIWFSIPWLQGNPQGTLQNKQLNSGKLDKELLISVSDGDKDIFRIEGCAFRRPGNFSKWRFGWWAPTLHSPGCGL